MAMAFRWAERSVLVTGATGLLGSWLAADLHRKGAEVVTIMRDVVPNSNFFMLGLDKKVSVARGELESYRDIERALNEYEVEAVFHAGAQTIVGTANRSPLATFEANVRGTWNLLEACRHSKLVRRIVVASSDKAYGESMRLPYTEEMPLEGRHPYDVSKSCADLISTSYYRTYGMPVTITRCGNIYGGGDLNFNRLVPGTIRSALAGEEPVIRSDGKYVRDYFYVLDAVEAYVALAERMEDQKLWGEAFNFGTEEKFTVLEIVKKILALTKPSLKPRILNEASGEIREQHLSAKKAHRILGWKARYPLAKGLKETVAWYKGYLRGRKGKAD
jgi:CDP-glucose 4,6-dehydratase